jgi:anti-sigma B factor antagonist
MQELDFINEKFDDVTLVNLNIPDATLQSAGRFKNHMTRLIDKNERKLIVNCKDVNYMDSTFLGALVFSLKKAATIGGDLRLILQDVQSPVWTMFESTKMFRVFKTYKNIEEAVKSYSE